MQRAEAVVCTVERSVHVRQTGQQLVKVTLKVEPDAPLPAMMVQLPLGLFLPEGIELRVDEQPALPLAVQTCNADGCFAGSPVSETMLAALMAGQNLNVTFHNLSKKALTVPVPLDGLAPAYRKAR